MSSLTKKYEIDPNNIDEIKSCDSSFYVDIKKLDDNDYIFVKLSNSRNKLLALINFKKYYSEHTDALKKELERVVKLIPTQEKIQQDFLYSYAGKIRIALGQAGIEKSVSTTFPYYPIKVEDLKYMLKKDEFKHIYENGAYAKIYKNVKPSFGLNVIHEISLPGNYILTMDKLIKKQEFEKAENVKDRFIKINEPNTQKPKEI